MWNWVKVNETEPHRTKPDRSVWIRKVQAVSQPFPMSRGTWKLCLILIKSAFLLMHIASVRILHYDCGTGANSHVNSVFVCLLVRWHGFLANQARSQLCWQLYCVDKCTQFHKRAPTISAFQKSARTHPIQCAKDSTGKERWCREGGRKMRCFYRHHGFSHFPRDQKIHLHTTHTRSTCISILHIWYA